ncbi:MAG: sugar ABC transporter substrate-binding protein [Thermomicrobiales bacterium]|nr:sugar ABC transporter substrate-binding protein [Thermomicrobiales bacterium]
MGNIAERGPLAGLELEFVGDRLKKGFKRRDAFRGSFAMLGALAMATGVGRHATAAQGLASLGLLPEDLPAKKYTAATSEVGAASTWVSHGMDVVQFFGSLLGVEVTSFDGEFSVEKQLQDLQSIASQDFDFVAVHPSASGALVDAANQIIAKGVPLIDMDTRFVQDPAEFEQYGHLTFLEPDNVQMGKTIAEELFKAMDYEGEVIHTQGQLAHTGAQGRAEGFHETVAKYPNIKVVDETPGDWKVDQVASLWQDLLQRFPNVKGGFFHSDDMALAASSVIEAAGKQDQVKIVGVDGQKNACEAILANKMTASVINPSGRIHGGAIWAGYLTVSGTDNSEGGVPKFIRTDGGSITIQNAPGYIWLHDNMQY